MHRWQTKAVARLGHMASTGQRPVRFACQGGKLHSGGPPGKLSGVSCRPIRFAIVWGSCPVGCNSNLSVHRTGDLGVRPPGTIRKASELKAFLSTPSSDRFGTCESHNATPRDARRGPQKIPVVLAQAGFTHEGLDGLKHERMRDEFGNVEPDHREVKEPVEALVGEGAGHLSRGGGRLGECEGLGESLDVVLHRGLAGLDGLSSGIEIAKLSIVVAQSLLHGAVVAPGQVLHLPGARILEVLDDVSTKGGLEGVEEDVEVAASDGLAVALIVAIITSTLPRASRASGHAARRGSNERGRPPGGGGQSSQTAIDLTQPPNPTAPVPHPHKWSRVPRQ